MPRIKKDKPKPHILVCDTSILWCEDKASPVNPDFDEMCRECSALLDIELVVPSTVHGELHFQQTTSAAKALDRANQAFAEISIISARPYTHRVTSAKIKTSVRLKLEKWVSENRVRVAPVPVSAIDWNALIEKAIWREPPFTFDPKDKINEKGFRDALILETLVELTRAEQRDVKIVFLSSDNLLRTTAEQALKSDNRCLFFDSIDSFKSYVKLTGEELTQRFINRLLSRATEKFYKKDDETCLYTREAILSKLQTQFKDYFENPQKAESATSLLLTMTKWRISNGPRIRIDKAQFIRLKPKSIYHWANQLTYLCLYRTEGTGFTFQAPGTGNESLLILAFLVKWHAFVKADGRFHEVTLDDLSLLVSSFAPTTTEVLNRYGFQTGET